jgi:hypothetical protein
MGKRVKVMAKPNFSCIILGCGRSGTSLMAGLLGKAGFFHGDCPLPADLSNPTGYFEDRTVEEINEELIARQLSKSITYYVDKHLLRRQPPPGVRWLAPIRRPVSGPPGEKLERMMRERIAHHPFCYKDPRFCHTLGAWRPHWPAQTRYVVLFRDPASTAHSMLIRKAARPYARQFRLSYHSAMWLWWSAYRHAIDTLPGDAQVAFVHYGDLLAQDPPPALAQLLHGIQLDWSIVNRRFNRSSGQQDESRVPAMCRDLYQELCARAGRRRAQAA